MGFGLGQYNRHEESSASVGKAFRLCQENATAGNSNSPPRDWFSRERSQPGGRPTGPACRAAPSVGGRRNMDWLHLFGRSREDQVCFPEFDRGHVLQRRMNPEVVAPMHVVRQHDPQLACRAERLAVDELGLQHLVGRLVDRVVVRAPLLDSDRSMPKPSSISSTFALPNSPPRSVRDTSMSDIGRDARRGGARAGLRRRQSVGLGEEGRRRRARVRRQPVPDGRGPAQMSCSIT